MNDVIHLQWEEFKGILKQYPTHNLLFRYDSNKWVDGSYHVTEIKQTPITSVDCGGVVNNWTEVVVQLWEPGGKSPDRSMEVNKALAIISLVEGKINLESSATVKIEFGNAEFAARQMYPGEITVNGQDLVVDLQQDVTQCKAINRGGTCGTDRTMEGKPGIINLEVITTGASCVPGSGCC